MVPVPSDKGTVVLGRIISEFQYRREELGNRLGRGGGEGGWCVWGGCGDGDAVVEEGGWGEVDEGGLGGHLGWGGWLCRWSNMGVVV